MIARIKEWLSQIESRKVQQSNDMADENSRGAMFKTVPVPALDGFVCYFDILGYSSFVLNSDLKETIDDLVILRSILLQSAILTYQSRGLLNSKEDMAKYALNPFDYSLSLPFYYVITSDSVFYWGMHSVDNLIAALESACFSMHMMAIRQKRYARGAVTRGKTLINPLGSIYYGKPIVEAVSIEKKMTAPGIIVPLKYLNSDERRQMVKNLPYFIPCNYRYKDTSSEKCLYINWVYYYSTLDKSAAGF
jgi:hypothetical protein